jgi:hypothetical protein
VVLPLNSPVRFALATERVKRAKCLLIGQNEIRSHNMFGLWCLVLPARNAARRLILAHLIEARRIAGGQPTRGEGAGRRIDPDRYRIVCNAARAGRCDGPAAEPRTG